MPDDRGNVPTDLTMTDDVSSGRETYYDVLGIEPQSDHAKIAAAYWRLVHRCERDPGAVQQIERLNKAYEVLQTSHTRREYDAGLRTEVSDYDVGDAPGRRRLPVVAILRGGASVLRAIKKPSSSLLARWASVRRFAPARRTPSDVAVPASLEERAERGRGPAVHGEETYDEPDNAERLRASTAAVIERWRNTQPTSGEWTGLEGG